MMAVSCQTFVATLAKSNLLSEEQMAAVQKLLGDAEPQEDGRKLAGELVRKKWVTRWQAAQMLAGRSSFFLGKYKLLEQIGQGGMGTVFRAQHTVMNRVVAIKVMSRDLLNNPEAVSRFRREVESAAQLNHPNIVTVYDASCVGSIHFLVMEYVEGQDLKYWLRGHAPLPIAWACECIRQAALGLQHAHERGLVHRDIKPGNLFVTAKDVNSPPHVRILDLGLARLTSQTAGDVTQTGVILGTPDYMSPEQAAESRSVDIRSDIYSLGCTLFLVLTEQLPFEGESVMEKLLARLQRKPPGVREFRPEVPTKLEAVVTRMLARDPRDRYQIPAEVAAALTPFCHELATGQSGSALESPDEAPPSPSSTSSVDAAGEPDSSLSEILNVLANLAQSETSAGADTEQGQHALTTVRHRERSRPAKGNEFPRRWVLVGSVAAVVMLLALGVLIWRRNTGDGPVAAKTSKQPPKVSKKTSEDLIFPPFKTGEGPQPPKKVEEPPKKIEEPPKKIEKTKPEVPPLLAVGTPVDLLKLIEIERDQVRGSSKLGTDGLALNGLLRIPFTPPAEYAITAVVQRTGGGGNFGLGVIADGRQTIVALDGDRDTHGLHMLKGQSVTNAPLAQGQKVLPPEKPVTVVCNVRKTRVHVACNGKVLFDWQGDPSQLSMDSQNKEWQGCDKEKLFVGSYNAQFGITKLEISLPSPEPLPLEGRTLIVGAQADQLPDLQAALEKARPGDTISIRLRGPLEFLPANLRGKTPLTIVGDNQSGVDFWPILRQAKLPNGASNIASPGLFFGDELNLTLRKVHLTTGGEDRHKIGALFGMASGRVELDHCTVTVGIGGNYEDPPGEPIPLIRAGGQPTGAVEVLLKQSFLRGLRLQHCVAAQATKQVNVTAIGTTWAGGPAPWLALIDSRGQMRVTLERSTIYNVPSLLRCDLSPGEANGNAIAVIDASKTLFIGPFFNRQPLVDWIPRDPAADLSTAAADRQFTWSGVGNVFHNFGGYYRKSGGKELGNLADWHRMWQQEGPLRAREVDPMFRVRPAGYELEHTEARDLRPRFERNTAPGHQLNDPELGADYRQQPYVPELSNQQSLPEKALAGKPRGVPRVRRVHQQQGPFKTLEAAFEGLQNEDIIEIADDGPYLPKRNFNVAPGQAVLVSPVDNLRIRAADGASPVIVLRDDIQQGTKPKDPLRLIATKIGAKTGSLILEGLHFRVNSSTEAQHVITQCESVAFFRSTNCTLVDASPSLTSGKATLLGHEFGYGGTGLTWLENDLYYYYDREHTHYVLAGVPRSARHYLGVRNCIVRGDLCLWRESPPLAMVLERNTILGRVGEVPATIKSLAVECNSNLVMSPTTAMAVEPAVVANCRKSGGDNGLWLGTRPLTDKERTAGVNALFPGPPLRTQPQPSGRSLPRDPYAGFELRANQPAAKMAPDGGPVGARVKYLPALPSLPKAFFQ